MDNITLIGMPGSGKSTVGVVLAKTLGMDFVDTDLMIQKREGKLLQRILDEQGIKRFLEIEEEVIRNLSCRGCIVAPGGSAVCREEAARHLKRLGRVVYIRLPLPDLALRIHNIKTRGIAAEPGQTLESIYELRCPLYEKYADITVDAEGKTVEQLVTEIVSKLKTP
ncbi:shikimate kinase [Papillibacter cinnamivorans]|uniref:Shikimate kinase n=1 Tax=Papillibacter cinnamivorans DSM 12816 TaxID=1122930 RepID=A0A1W2CQS4_9FIRM|nr:shikimate kinase [Papillibacter cinnamivorans]SMC87607.1 shikimate kinase [Papillibacter cinnamivorans DSM 12816]